MVVEKCSVPGFSRVFLVFSDEQSVSRKEYFEERKYSSGERVLCFFKLRLQKLLRLDFVGNQETTNQKTNTAILANQPRSKTSLIVIVFEGSLTFVVALLQFYGIQMTSKSLFLFFFKTN